MRSNARSRERLLVYGIGGVGKTKAYLDIAKVLDAGDRMFVIETDPSLDRMLEDPEFEGLGVQGEWDGGEPVMEDLWVEDGPLVVYHCRSWPDVRAAITEVWGLAGRDDWIVVDNISWPWEWVQDWYWQEVVGSERDEFLLEIRRAQLEAENREGTPQEDTRREWSFINPHYSKHFTTKMLNPPCHLFLTAEQTDMSFYDEKAREMQSVFGQIGVKPRGQKKSGHLTHTILHANKAGENVYRLRTVKDRGGRVELSKERWGNFAEDYLVGVAGWVKPRKTKTKGRA